MAMANRRNALLPWYIGLIIIAVTDVFIGYLFHSTNEKQQTWRSSLY